MGTRNKLLFAVVIVFVLVFISLIISVRNRPLYFQEYAVKFGVNNSEVGFEVNTRALTFGVLNPGGAGVRKITAENNYDFPIVLKILASSNLENLLNCENEIFLEIGEKKEIAFTLAIPENFEEGSYLGTVRVEARRR